MYAHAKLVLFFLKTKPQFFYLSDEVKEIWKVLKSGGAPDAEMKEIREAMLQLGSDPEEG
jgi:hypothetical protein